MRSEINDKCQPRDLRVKDDPLNVLTLSDPKSKTKKDSDKLTFQRLGCSFTYNFIGS